MFVETKCKLDLVNISKIAVMRNRQEVWVTLKSDELANLFEKSLIDGIEWSPGSGMIVTGQRLDTPSLHIKVRGAADDVKGETVTEILSQWGTVQSCTRGTAPIARKYKPGDPRWVCDGIFHVVLKVDDATTVPSYILADGDHWQCDYPGSARLCWKCLRQHPHWKCPARERQPEDGSVK